MRTASRMVTAAAGFLVLAGLIPGAEATPHGTVQENVRLIANVPGSTGGHSVVEGNRLYVGAYGLGMTIFDVTDPAAPKKIGEYKPLLSGAHTPSGGDPGARADAVPDAAVFGTRHIATLNGTGRGPGTQQTEFLDVTDPAKPVLLHRFTGGADGEAHNGDIVDARKLWLPSGGNGNSGLRIYDMSPLLESPAKPPVRLFAGNPQTLWQRSPYRGSKPLGDAFDHTHDIEIYTDYNLLLPQDQWTDQDADGVADPTYAKRDIALLAGATGYAVGTPSDAGAAYIIDITDPRNPVVINKWSHKNTGGEAIRYLHEVQFLHGNPNIMVVTDEDLHNGCDPSMIYSVELSPDLMTAKKLDEWSPGTGTPAPVCSGHVFSSHGNYVFMGMYNAGLQVIDFTNPADLKRAGQYIAEGANSWGALYHRGVIYVGDFGGRGLDVFEFIEKPAAKAFVKAPNPGTRTTGGVAERGCRAGDPYGPTNGTDGLIVPIPPSASDGKHKLRALGSSLAPYDLDIWFHGDNCASMGFPGGNDSRDAVETIPEGATMASIDLYVGSPQWVYAQIVG